MAKEKAYDYKSPDGLRLTLTIMVGIFVGSRVLSALLWLAFGQSSAYTEEQLDLSLEQSLRVIVDLCVFLLLAAYVVALFWMHRVSWNAHSFGRTMQHGTAAAVFWYFIPFASLVMPYMVMREVWEVSNNDDRRGGLIGLWWTSFIAFGVALNVTNIPGVPAALGVVCDLIIIGAAMVFIQMMRRMDRQQALTHAAGVFSDPKPAMIMMGDEPPAARPAQ